MATAIVTGAAVGMGAAFAAALTDAGFDVVGCDVRPGVAHRADVGKPEEVARVVSATLEAFGGVDVLINNAGVWEPSTVTDDVETTRAGFARTFDTNLRGAFAFGRAVIPHMVRARRGHIVNVGTDHVANCGSPVPQPHDETSDCAWADTPRGPGGITPADLYDASKWALNGLTLHWGLSLRDAGVRVNGICMGPTDSHMLRAFAARNGAMERNWMPAEYVAQIAVDLVLGRLDAPAGANVVVADGHPVAYA